MENEQMTASDFIQKVKEHSANATEAIANANIEFEKCIVEQSQGASKIIKEWAKTIKNDDSQLKQAYEHAEAEDLVSKYTQAITGGHLHRVCYRTFVVNDYIYKQLKMAENDSQAVNDMLSELESGEE